MKLTTLLLTKNDCYKSGRKHKVRGIMWHSTGANNPKLSRYVGPDDGVLGPNANNNHWNQPKPGGRSVCVHAFIGLDKNGEVRTYQTLPWDMVGWHSGSGSLGSSKNANNNGYIGFEICEDGLNDRNYFNKVYQEAIDLSVYLCKEYGLTEKDIICHSEGHKMGVASNHADVMHWFPKHGKSMDTVRADVKKALNAGSIPVVPKPPTASNTEYKVGDIVTFNGGPVYGSSNASTATTTKGVSRCKVTQVYNGKHPYHLISEDGKGVYGWVDAASIGVTAKATSYVVRVDITDLNIRKGPGTTYGTSGNTGKGAFTIVEEANGPGATKWGLLKSYEKNRNGWISLDFAKKI